MAGHLFGLGHRLRKRKLRQRLERSGLFDARWYAAQYPDTERFPGGVFAHYMLHGIGEDRCPGPKFDPVAYRERYHLDSLASAANAMEHYLFIGQESGNPIPPLTEAKIKDSKLYRGRRETVAQCGFFDAPWYIENNADLQGAHVDALEHFVGYGSKELRSPGPRFDARWYAEEYLLAKPNIEPLFHYLDHGAAQGHLTAPASRFLDWKRRYFDLTEEDRRLLARSRNETIFFYLFEGDRDALKAFLASAAADQLRARVHVVCAGPGPMPEIVKNEVLRSAAAVSDVAKAASDLTVLVFVRGAITLAPHCSEILQAYAEGQDEFIMTSDFLEPDEEDGAKPYFLPTLLPRLGAALEDRVHLFATRPRTFLSTIKNGEDVSELFSPAPYFRGDFRRIVVNQFTFFDASAVDLKPRAADGTWAPSVSIIIPTRDGLAYLKACIDSIINMTVYSGSIEIIIVDNNSVQIETLTYFDALQAKHGVMILKYRDEFNFASINNMAAAAASGEVLIFLNNDTSVIREDWVSILVAELADRTVGAVGAKLLYPDGLVQHGGVIIGIQAVAAHSHTLLPSNARGFQDLNLVTREVSAVTGACLALRRSVFSQIGGFDTNFKVAFNDIALCMTVMKAGFRNIFVAVALLYHHESKSRGYDTTPEKKARFFEETLMFRRIYGQELSDPHYSRSLSFQECYALAEPPRGVQPWRLRGQTESKRKVLVLSSTYQLGHGVAVVIDQQIERLLRTGWDVWLGGPMHDREIIRPNVRRIDIDTPELAAKIAVRYRFDLVLVHTPPFYSITRYLENYPAVLNYDYGEPPPDLFPDRSARESVNREKLLCFAMSRYKAAISKAVAEEMPGEVMPVLPLANSHLARWTPASDAPREKVRRKLGWTDKFVILNVGRFYAAERLYKGVSDFIDIAMRVKAMNEDKVVVALCGRGRDQDIEYIESRGVQVFPNVSDEEVIELYQAADVFISMSKWEGYNLPIGQAMAMGLPVLASKIPAHDAFGIETFVYHTSFVSRLSEMIRAGLPPRAAKIWEWSDSLDTFERFIENIYEESRERALSRL